MTYVLGADVRAVQQHGERACKNLELRTGQTQLVNSMATFGGRPVVCGRKEQD